MTLPPNFPRYTAREYANEVLCSIALYSVHNELSGAIQHLRFCMEMMDVSDDWSWLKIAHETLVEE